eukprot:gene9182-1473_t
METTHQGPSTLSVITHALRDCLRISSLCAVCSTVLQPLHYQFLANYWPYSDRTWFVVATVAVHETMYYGLNGAFLLMSKYGILHKYKIDRGNVPEPSQALVLCTLKESTFSHWIIQPLSLYLIFPAFTYFGMNVRGGPEAGPFLPMVLRVSLAVLLNDALFYWSHRLLHHPHLYARFHKQHHEYKGTIGFAAEYASPLEQLLSNQIPSVLGALLSGMSTAEWLVYLFWRLWRTYEVHRKKKKDLRVTFPSTCDCSQNDGLNESDQFLLLFEI